jgi:hypothetical protein
LERLQYEPQVRDPDWAFYAVIFYSAFYDMGDRLIRTFGQDPGPPPESFTFGAVTSVETLTDD